MAMAKTNGESKNEWQKRMAKKQHKLFPIVLWRPDGRNGGTDEK
jgi:hypothetical protein